MIRYLEKQNLLILETERTSYWIGLAYPAPVCLHWGRKIAPEDADMFEPLGGHSSFDTELWRERMEYPAFDGRTFENVSLKADVPLNLRTKDVRVQGQQAEITLADEVSVMEVRLIYRVFEDCDVIQKHARLTANAPIRLTRMDSGACLLPHEAKPWTAHYVVGAWAGEFRRRTAKLEEGELRLQSVRGMSGPHMNPFLIAANSEDEETGEAYGVALGWSGCWQITASSTVFGNHRITAGLNDADLVCPMGRGECFETPPMVLCMSAEGMGALSRRMHDFERNHLKPNRPPRRVLYNSWEATQFDVRADAQMRLAERAARMGVELFVVDDGWFGDKYPRNKDNSSLGDWMVDARKLPRGIEGLIADANKHGIKFGIWIEPEMANTTSELYEKHPEWVLKAPNREIVLGRGGTQVVLDLSNSEVQDFIFGIVDNLMTTYPEIDYIKWDANMSILNHGSQYLPSDQQSHMYIEYHEGFKKVCERIRAKYPDLTLQACASGGGRANYGVMPYFDEFWVSDNTDALQRIYMQWGTSYFFPAIAMASHISAAPNHQTFRVIPLKYRIDVAMSGRLGMEIQPKNMTEEEKTLCRKAIADYKTIRPVVQFGDIYRLVSPYDRLGVASLMYTSPEKDKAVFYWWKTEHFVNQHLPRVKMNGLSPDKKYRVCELNRIDNEPLAFEGKAFTGEYLMANGLEIPYNHIVDYHKQNDYSSRVLYLEEVK